MRWDFGIGPLAVTAASVVAFMGPGCDSRSSARAGDRTKAPPPSAIWPAGPLDLVVAFPRPVDAALARSLVGQTIPYYEPVKPGAVQSVGRAPLGRLRIAGVKPIDEGRTLLVATDPHPRMARYELVLGPAADSGAASVYDLSGVEAAWSAGEDHAAGERSWTGWWPELDLESARKQAQGSAPHQRLMDLIEKPGHLLVSTQLLLAPGEVTVRVEASRALSEATLGDEQPAVDEPPAPGGLNRMEFRVRTRGEPLYLSFTVETGPTVRPPVIRASYAMGHGKPGRFRAIERERLLLPWTPALAGSMSAAPSAPQDLAGGDPRRGEALFFGEQARCSQCHSVRGRGGSVGPELTSVGGKGLANLYQSIAAPSAEIAPDYVSYTVAARDGRVLSGVVRAEGPGAIRVTDTNAKVTTLSRDDIDQIRPGGTSIMPVGLAGGLGENNLRDLIAFLIQLVRQE